MGRIFEGLSDLQLLQRHVVIIEELRRRGVVRTSNNPTGDYAEHLIEKKFKFTLEPPSNKSFDATDASGRRYQIKARRISPNRSSRQLSVIRSLEKAKFDFLIAVIFNEDFSVFGCYKMPKSIIKEYARYSKHQNGHILIMKGAILEDKRVDRLEL